MGKIFFTVLWAALINAPNLFSAACSDSTTYRLLTYKQGFEITRKCSWLTQNAAKTAFRLAKFCGQYNNGNFVDDACPSSCNNCSPTDKPSRSPSTQPTKSSSPSKVVSSSPTGTPTKSSQPTAVASPKPSNFATGAPSDPPSQESSSPTIAPTNSPRPTSVASQAPTSVPSSKPTVQPSAPCEDDPDYSFVTYNRGNAYNRSCNWLTNRADKEDVRVAKFCYNETRDQCRVSCRDCTP